MKFTIAQKLLQTDWYEVEADTMEMALDIYEQTKGELNSSGSTSGWSFAENEEVKAIKAIKNGDNTETNSKGKRKKK